MLVRLFVFPTLAALTFLGVDQDAPRARALGAAATKTATARVAGAEAAPAVPVTPPGMHRYMVVRTFPAGALDGLDAAGKKQVNKTNASSSVRWVLSFANANKTRTFCIYEGPSEKAIRDAAAANKIPVDEVIEIPLVLNPN